MTKIERNQQPMLLKGDELKPPPPQNSLSCLNALQYMSFLGGKKKEGTGQARNGLYKAIFYTDQRAVAV